MTLITVLLLTVVAARGMARRPPPRRGIGDRPCASPPPGPGGILLAAAADIPLQDGLSYSGTVALANATVMEGDTVTTTTYTITGTTDFSCTSNCFSGSLIVGEHLWMIPSNTPLAVVRVHKTTGVMTSFNGWAGVTLNFAGASYDPIRSRLWLPPNSGANHVIHVDVTTGTMGVCAYGNWPSGLGTIEFLGSFVAAEDYLWMAPSAASKIVRVDMSGGCSMTGYNSWPSGVGFTLSGSPFQGVVFDGVRFGWLIPQLATHMVKLDTTDGSMIGFNTWPTSPSFTPGSYPFSGGTFDGQFIWIPPSQAARGGDPLVEAPERPCSALGS